MLPNNAIHFSPSAKSYQHLSKLDPNKVKLLEESSTFGLREKIELLGLLTHTKWVTEVDSRRSRIEPDKAFVDALAALELPWQSEHYTKKDGMNVYWMQVGANRAILEYLTKNKNRLSVLEAGLLYGYPPTAVLGCANLIEPYYKPVPEKSIAELCLAGVFSAEFSEREIDDAKRLWDYLTTVSPKIMAEAEQYYRQRLSEMGT